MLILLLDLYKPVADPGFSPGGAPTPKSAIIFQIFCRKLHENERIWTPGGGRASLAPPLGSANVNVIDFRSLQFNALLMEINRCVLVT